MTLNTELYSAQIARWPKTARRRRQNELVTPREEVYPVANVEVAAMLGVSEPQARGISMAGTITYLEGDATVPQAKGNKIIAHVCNDTGGWGRGFVVAISRRWPEPEREYRRWHRERAHNDFGLGAVRLVKVKPDTWVANMVGQHGVRGRSNPRPIRYEALDTCLRKVAEEATELAASVHMPRIGCGLAGGTWDRVEPLIAATLAEPGVVVYVYDYE